MLDLRNTADVWDVVRATALVAAIFVGMFVITRFYPFNNLLSLLIMSSTVLIGALWIRIAPPRKRPDDRGLGENPE